MTIAAEIRSGSKKAYEVFYRLEYNNLVHFIFSYTSDRERSEDLAQEALCTLWEKREKIKPESNLRAWVFTIAKNLTLNALREKKLFADPAMRSGIDEKVAALEDSSMDGLIDSLELSDLIKKAWESLPDTAADTFRKSRLEGKTNREISLEKGVNIKTVEYHVKISLRYFREKLKDYLP